MIINLGLPRTGTRSLEEAAKILGFRHLTQPLCGPVWSAFHKNRAVPSDVEDTVMRNWTCRFICTVRGHDAWLDSVLARFPAGNHQSFSQTFANHGQGLAASRRVRATHH